MRTPEAIVKAKVKEFLHANKVQSLTHPIEGAVGFYWMPVVGVFGSPLVDFVICYRSRFIAVETKAAGGKVSARQKVILDRLREGGALTVVGDDETVIKWLTLSFAMADRNR
jgi:hypothetical protein